jgi:hypothetical protein
LKGWAKLWIGLNEAQRRWHAAHKALELGWGGVRRVHEVTGMSRPTIAKGIRELERVNTWLAEGRIRGPGGGRKPLQEHDPGLVPALKGILKENTAGDPMSALRWTHKSTRTIAEELTRQGHAVSHSTVAQLLDELGYSLQANRKDKEGRSPPERDRQFRYINRQAKRFAAWGQPVISVDAKKKEKIGNLKNPGRTWRKKGDAHKVDVHDFVEHKAIPYGTYDPERNEGFVNVGISHETAEFAVESIRRWWKLAGQQHYPRGRSLLICADCGGSNGSRRRGWKVNLQEFADEFGLRVTVCHYPPGTSKWNKIEHRMFSHISLNWQGKPLVDYQTVVNLIAGTRTRTGLRIRAKLDTREYEKGIPVPDQEMGSLNFERHKTLPEWNYTIAPRRRRSKGSRRKSKTLKL